LKSIVRMLAAAALLALDSSASPIQVGLAHPPTLESLGWRDGIMTGLLGDRRDERDPGQLPDDIEALEFLERTTQATDQIVLDSLHDPQLELLGYAEIVTAPVVESSAAEMLRPAPPESETMTVCSLSDDPERCGPP